ncbi:MAG: hypothetical protein Rubg2KO_10260 [Rubricoccaceae bacterium]
MFPALRPILNKGGAGRYISREESVERLQPMVVHQLDLVYLYDSAVSRLADSPAKTRLVSIMPNLRTELSKLYETVYSLGGTAPTGVERDALATDPGETDAERLGALVDAETAFGEALREEADAVHHQERTRAILLHNADASSSRLSVLREFAQTSSRRA